MRELQSLENSRELRRQRDAQLLRCIPDIFDYHTLLYIGCKLRWNYPTFRGQDGFDKAGYEIDIIELHPKNLEKLRKANLEGHEFLNGYQKAGMFRNIIAGDVRDTLLLTSYKYDVVMWWQGPEHLPWYEIGTTLENLYLIAEKILVIGCPCSSIFGPHPMSRLKKFKAHPGERQIGISAHLSLLSPDFFESLGFTVDIVGECDERGNNLLAFKRV